MTLVTGILFGIIFLLLFVFFLMFGVLHNRIVALERAALLQTMANQAFTNGTDLV